MPEAETVSREGLKRARAEIDEVGGVLKDLKVRAKKLRSAGKPVPDDFNQQVAQMERRYRNLRASLRRMEAASGR